MKVLNNIIAITYYKFRRNIWMSTKSLQSKIKNNLYWETHDRMFNIKEPIKNRLIDSIIQNQYRVNRKSGNQISL